MKTRHLLILFLTAATAFAETPKGLSDSDWSSIRAAYEAGRHQFFPQADGTHLARNPGLGWNLTFDETGFTATDGTWTWGLELAVPSRSSEKCAWHTENTTLSIPRSADLTEWFINDSRGLEQGWTLTAPAAIHLRVRGDLQPEVSAQSVTFGGQITYSGLKAWDARGQTVPVWFEPADGGFQVCYNDEGATYPLTIDPIAQNAYLKASNTGSNDSFGSSVAVSGDTVVVGASGESSKAKGVNGNQANDDAPGSGAAYVFVRRGTTWGQQAYLKASNSESGDNFGFTVAISGDIVVVGAYGEASKATGVNGNQANNDTPFSGAAYVFVRSGITWTQQAYLKASNPKELDQFGFSVAVSGETVVVGARGEGFYFGAAYVFVRSGSTWAQQAYLKSSNLQSAAQFGYSVGISGDTLVVGAFLEGSSATGVNGNEGNNAAANSGAAYVFVRSAGTWTQQAYLKASNTQADDWFGHSVAISGDAVVVGAPSEDSNATGVDGNQGNNGLAKSGAAYVFARSGGTWTQQAYLKASNTDADDWFGYSVAISGDLVVVGARQERSNATGINGNEANNNLPQAGAAYAFRRNGNTWTQQAYLKASNTGQYDQFGTSVAASGDRVVIGAYGEGSNATGVNGDQANNDGGVSGAAYLFNFGDNIDDDDGKDLASAGGSGASVPGVADLVLGIPGLGALSSNGEFLLQTSLSGAAAAGGRNRGLLSSVGGPLRLASQTGDLAPVAAGLPVDARIAGFDNLIHNRSASSAIYQLTLRGSGLDRMNNTMLVEENGASPRAILRTGVPLPGLGDVIPSGFREVLQRQGATDQILLNSNLRLDADTPVVGWGTITGILVLDHSGKITNSTARQGNPGYGGGGTFGQIGRAAILNSESIGFLAKFIPTAGGSPVDGCFFRETTTEGRRFPLQGELAPGTAGERLGAFTGVTRSNEAALIRATLRNNPASTNEGVWHETEGLRLRKGQGIGTGLILTRILRVWGIDNGQVVAHVQLGGTGVTPRNNQALILRQTGSPNTIQILLRSGDPAPGVGLNGTTIGPLQAIDVDPVNGHYAILTSLVGAPASANQALWSGQTTLGNDTTLAYLRLPRLQLQKGEIYHTEATFEDLIRSIALRPAVDPSGVGGRGLAQVINERGQILLTLTGDRKVQETVLLTP